MSKSIQSSAGTSHAHVLRQELGTLAKPLIEIGAGALGFVTGLKVAIILPELTTPPSQTLSNNVTSWVCISSGYGPLCGPAHAGVPPDPIAAIGYLASALLVTIGPIALAVGLADGMGQAKKAIRLRRENQDMKLRK